MAALDPRQRGFLLLTVYVLAQQGQIARARVLAEALHAAGDDGVDGLFVRAVIRFLDGDHPGTLRLLDDLDRRDPVERFGAYRLTDRQRVRRYLKARCLDALGDAAGAREAVDSYLRHGDVAGRTG
ncbi:hypothetical protein [Chthonobacter rhizosphaerae]|uniref:hypothetical protein n=1 Tax=Chthonobacter rhizosphaerae TaxID=2735553 RepID=UPI0015EE5E6D|nr:hypothetical protein [Chthonobacter rhizosphaerae]